MQPRDDFMIGRTLSHYKILSKLGEGGMGVVYKAEDLKLKRFVALKFLHQQLHDGSAAQRFIHEARTISALEHPNICAIYEIDSTAEGQMFIVMPCYEGESLQKKIERGPLPIDEALAIGSQIASGLARAHENGIIHRDIKPGNVLLTKDGVKIVDFGLAKLTTQTKLTRTGATLGTVMYMSPEQARGAEVDHRSDIWSLGVILYEMVTGRSPFHGEYDQALIYSILNEEPELATSVRKDAPAELEDIIAKAIAKKPEERYQSVADLLAALTALRQELSIGPGGQVGRRISKAARRRALRRWLKVGIPFGAFIAVSVAALLYLRSSSDMLNARNLSMAVIDFRDSVNPDDPAASAGITGLVQVGLTEISHIRVISPELIHDIHRRLFGSQRGSIEADQILEVARNAGSTFFVTGEIMGTITEQYVTWRLVDTKSGKSLGGRRVMGASLMELADGIINSVIPLLPGRAEGKTPTALSSTTEIITSSEEAYKHYTRGDLAFAEGRFDEGLAEMQQAVEMDSTFALAYYRLADAIFGANPDDKASTCRYAERAWVHRGHLGLKDRMKLEAMREQLEGNIPGAIMTFKEIYTRWPDNLDALTYLTYYLFWYWYFDEAVSVSEKGLTLYPDDPLFLGTNRSARRELGQGEEVLQEWIVNAREQPQQKWVWAELGECYWMMGVPDSAEVCFRRERYFDNWPGELERRVADCFYARGDVNHAIEIREELLKRPDLPDDERYRTLTNGWAGGLVVLPAEIGRFTKSFELLREYEGVMAVSKTRIPIEKIDLLIRMGQAAEAADLARATLKQLTEPQDSLRINLRLIEALAGADSVKEARLLLTAVLKLDENVLWSANRYHALLLRSVVALADKDPDGALRFIQEAGKMAEPTMMWLGIARREILARAHWKAGHLEEAVDTYKSLLKVFGGHAISHYELGQVYERMKRPADAKKEYAKFLEMWSQADVGLPQLVDARKRLAAL